MDFNKNDDNAYASNNIFSTTNYCLFSNSTSTSPPSTSMVAMGGPGPGLYRARLILENQLYNELLNRYRLAITRLRQLSRDTSALQEENEWFRLANEELSHRLNRVLSVTEQPCMGFTNATGRCTSSSTGDYRQINALGGDLNSSTTSNDDDDDDDDDNEEDDERFSVPKSISLRSPGFFKLVNLPLIENNQSSISPSQHVNGARLKVRKEEKAIDLEVFNQGMYKTELCNKWQETGTCPYGPHCQYAHGLSELRSVIRHPRYKTQVCRMVVSGVACPYGHRCHFRHSLS